MKVRVELLSLLRAKAGSGAVELEVGGRAEGREGDASGATEGPTVLEVLEALEAWGEAQDLSLLEGGELRRGLLAFVRSAQAPMRRAARPALERLAPGESLILATAMDGG